MNFILERGVESFSAEGTEPEERYINFVFSVFKTFSYEEGERYIEKKIQKDRHRQKEAETEKYRTRERQLESERQR